MKTNKCKKCTEEDKQMEKLGYSRSTWSFLHSSLLNVVLCDSCGAVMKEEEK